MRQPCRFVCRIIVQRRPECAFETFELCLWGCQRTVGFPQLRYCMGGNDMRGGGRSYSRHGLAQCPKKEAQTVSIKKNERRRNSSGRANLAKRLIHLKCSHLWNKSWINIRYSVHTTYSATQNNVNKPPASCWSR